MKQKYAYTCERIQPLEAKRTSRVPKLYSNKTACQVHTDVCNSAYKDGLIRYELVTYELTRVNAV